MWAVVSASVIGTSHETNATPCQDSCQVVRSRIAEQDVLLIAVADGAGSASHSQIGSREAVEHLLKVVVRDAPNLASMNAAQARGWFHEVLEHLTRVADQGSISLNDLACTLLLAVVWPHGAVFAQVGDGAWVAECNGQLQAATWPPAGEYANITVFVTSKGALHVDEQDNAAHFQFRRLDGPIGAIAGFSDGLQSLALDYARRAPFEPFFHKVFAPLRTVEDETQLIVPLRQLLASEVINSRTDDDKTLVLGVWRGPATMSNSDGIME
jgi:hypothetical protein